jgi:hypothetical protein
MFQKKKIVSAANTEIARENYLSRGSEGLDPNYCELSVFYCTSYSYSNSLVQQIFFTLCEQGLK